MMSLLTQVKDFVSDSSYNVIVTDKLPLTKERIDPDSAFCFA